MKITVEISARESRSIAKLMDFVGSIGSITPRGIEVRNKFALLQGKLVSTVKVPDKYLSAITSLVEQHDMELRSVISGAMSVGFGVVSLAGTLGKDLRNLWSHMLEETEKDVREEPAGLSFAERVALHRQLDAIVDEINDDKARIDELECSNLMSFEELELAELKEEIASLEYEKKIIEAKLAA